MTATIVVLVLSTIVSLLLNLVGSYSAHRWLIYVFKPLTTSLVVAMALLPNDSNPRYRLAVVAGLILSLAGDVFLMLPHDQFVAGLASFLLAHLAYLIAFTADVRFGAPVIPFAFYAMIGAILVALLWPRLGRLKIPVLMYVAVILAMAAQAASRAMVLDSTAARLAAVGAALFVCSDALLAWNRFRRRFLIAEALIMTTYIAAQALIALSVRVWQ